MGFFNFIFAGMLLLFFVSMTIGADHQSLSVGYATVDSPERAQNISTKLLSDKLAESVVIIPGVTSLRASEDLKTPQSISTAQAQLLLIETQDELIGSVRAGIETIYEGINVPQVLFSHVRGPPSFLDFIVSRTGANAISHGFPIGKYEEPGKEIVIGLEGEKAKDKLTDIPTQKSVYIYRENEYQVSVKLDESIMVYVQGLHHEWAVDRSATSKSLRYGPFYPFAWRLRLDAPKLFMEVVPTETGNQTLTLQWKQSDNPIVKVITIIVS